VAEQLKTAAIKNYAIVLDEPAERDDGSVISDYRVRAALVRKGFDNALLEWMRCSVKDLKTVLIELRTGQQITGTRDPPRQNSCRLHRTKERGVRMRRRDGSIWTGLQEAGGG
jgi:hypothetical protein